MYSDYKIVSVGGHYAAYDRNGKFVCSGDSKDEVRRELESIEKEREESSNRRKSGLQEAASVLESMKITV